jgi:tetratricopeptide (TPR) repeat protein
MTETLFERYKEALRAGHVAVLRGRLEDAAVAYREAIEIARDRSVPRTALGGVHLRLGEPAAALEAYEGALVVAPDDDAALLGRAQALVVLRRTAEAAATYDRLVAARASAGRPAEALEAARRALAIEPSAERRERHAGLLVEVRGGAPDVPGELGEASEAEAAEAEAAKETEAGGDTAADEAAATAPRADPEDLVAEVDAAAARGDGAAAGAAALEAARAYRAAGRTAAAIDACLAGIVQQPADVDLHLLLAEIALDAGWSGPAGDAYAGLLRLLELDGDDTRREAVRAIAAERLPGDPRFAAA